MHTSVRARNLTLVWPKQKAFQHGLRMPNPPHPSISSPSSASSLAPVANVSPSRKAVPSRHSLWRAPAVSELEGQGLKGKQSLDEHVGVLDPFNQAGSASLELCFLRNGYVHVDQQVTHVMYVLNAFIGAVKSCMKPISIATTVKNIKESSYSGWACTCRNPEHHGCNAFFICGVRKYGGGSSHGLLWNYRSLSSVAFDPNVKSQVSSKIKREEHDTRTDEGILAVWDHVLLLCDHSTLIKLAPSFNELALIRLGNNVTDGDPGKTDMDGDPARTIAFGQRILKVFKFHEPSSLKHASWLCIIALAYQRFNEFEKAVEHAEEAASILQHSRGTSHKKDTLMWKTLAVLVVCKNRLGRPSHEIVPYVNKYIILSEKLWKPGGFELGLSYQLGGQAYCEANQPYEALHCCSKALPIFNQHYGRSSPQVARIRHIRSKAYLCLGKYKNSLLECEKARPFIDTTDVDVGDVDLVSVKCLLERQEYKEAITRLKKILKNNPKTSSLYASALIFIARVYAAQQWDSRFVKWCTRAVAAFGNLEPSLGNGASVRYLARLQQQQGNSMEALVIMKSALEVYNHCNAKVVAAVEVAEIEGEIGLLLLNMGKFDEALPYFENYVVKMRGFHGLDKKKIMEMQSHVQMAYSITKKQKMSEELQSQWSCMFVDCVYKN